MSVATSTCSLPVLEVGERRVRASWLLLPWIAHGSMPSCSSCSARRLAPCLVRVNTRHLAPVARPDEVREQRRACCARVTRIDALLDRSTGALRARDCRCVCGLLQDAAREIADLVGEGRREQQVLPLRRQQREQLRMVADEAHVEHAVGFVEHQHLDCATGRRVRCCRWSSRRPGVATRMSTPAAQRLDLRLDADAAEDQRAALAAGAGRRS